jgi:capsular exopolysaccharide synthesis family protein
VADDGDGPHFREFSAKHADKLIVSTAMSAPLREHYRQLGATLHHAQAETGVKVLMISSALPEEGKTLTATNIALTLSESYQRNVLLIDADLRRPSLDEVFQLPKVFGLSETLGATQERPVSLIQVSQHLSVLLAGAPDSDPMSKLTSSRMRRLITEAAAAFDWVIIDTPPVGILTDAKLLCAMADCALLVVRAGKTPAALVQKAIESLGRERIMGVVLNRAEVRSTTRDNSYYASYYYSSRARK